MKRSSVEIVREYGPFPGLIVIYGVTVDARNIWFATGDRLNAADRKSGELVRTLDVPAMAGTAYDGRYLFQIADDIIQKIDPETGEVLSKIPAPGGGGNSGLAWADGVLWVGENRACKIHQIEPETGKLLRTLQTDKFVTGVSWVAGELWHGSVDGETRLIRRLDPDSGKALEELEMPSGTRITGLEGDGEHFYCGGGDTQKIVVVRRRA